MKYTTVHPVATTGQVPPYCFQLPSMSAEAAAAVAVRELRIHHPVDALALPWELRRHTQNQQTQEFVALVYPVERKRDSGLR